MPHGKSGKSAAGILRRTLVFLLSLATKDCCGLKDVQLHITPRVVQLHHHAILHCTYDLEDAPLYTVKWYRGRHEFYRFSPSDNPPTKMFPLAGITVNVNNSNSTQVMLEHIEFNLSGNFSCEVTTDTEPILSTGMDTQVMLVVQLPNHPPTISIKHEPLDIGDVLQANCSSPSSRPPAILIFQLNNLTVDRTQPLALRRTQESEWSDLILELPLSSYHFHQGRLILTCIAQIADVYNENATLEVRSARNPVPEHVRATNSASWHSNFVSGTLTLFLHLLNIFNT